MKIYSKILIVFVFLFLSLFLVNNQLFAENDKSILLDQNSKQNIYKNVDTSEINNKNFKAPLIGIVFLTILVIIIIIFLNLDITFYGPILVINCLFFVYLWLKFYSE